MKKIFVGAISAVVVMFVFQVILGVVLFKAENSYITNGTEAPGCVETLYKMSIMTQSDIREIVSEENGFNKNDTITKMYINGTI